MRVRKMDLEMEFDIVKEFYPDPISKEKLPKDTSYVVVDDEYGICASGFLYLTNGYLALMEGFYTKKDIPKQTQGRALMLLARTLEKLARGGGYKSLFGFVPEDNFPVADFYKRNGAIPYTKLMRIFTKEL